MDHNIKNVNKSFFKAERFSVISRILSAIRTAIYVYKNPGATNLTIFQLNQQMFDFITRVQKENRPYFSKFGVILPEGERDPIVTIWATPNPASTPEKRITELVEENITLRAELEKAIKDNQKAEE